MNDRMKIMIVEDDNTLAQEISRFLLRWGYETYIPEDFENITEEFVNKEPQLILMDVGLPYYDGFYWCAQIRQISEVPVLYISSRNDDRDKIMAIAQGGDDYIEKPFRLELLKAKIEALLRRAYQYRVKTKIYLNDTVSFDGNSGTLYYKDTEIELTKSERKIIAKLLEEQAHVVTREELMVALWSTDEYVSDGTLTTLISRLRSKLKEICNEEIILTRKGQGYLIL